MGISRGSLRAMILLAEGANVATAVDSILAVDPVRVGRIGVEAQIDQRLTYYTPYLRRSRRLVVLCQCQQVPPQLDLVLAQALSVGRS